MSSVIELLSELRKLDIKLSLLDGKLKISAPKGALNDELKQRLKENKDDIIKLLGERESAAKGAAENFEGLKIPKLANYEDVPASSSQARFWFLEKLSPGQALFNIPLPVEIRGELDQECLRQSIEFLINRHDSLRTTFVEREGEPYLNIASPSSWSLQCEDIQGDNQEAIDSQILSLVQGSVGQAFDLIDGPLFRSRLFQLKVLPEDADQRPRYLLLNCIHHIICDGWSMDIILREIAASYIAFSQGSNPNQSPLLNPLKLQYADFAAWQHQQLNLGREKVLFQYWQKQLEGACGLVAYPYDRARALNPSSEGSTFNFSLNEKLTKEVNLYCQKKNITPFILLMAAYQIVLAKHAEFSDISVGIPIAGRNQEALEPIIGLFINALVIRSQARPESSVANYLTEIKENILEGFDHQDLSIEKLIDSLDIDREKEEVPGVQFGFILQNTMETGTGGVKSQAQSFDTGKMSIKALSYEGSTSKHDICLSLMESENQYRCTLEYRTALLDQASIKVFAVHFERCLQALLSADAEMCINDIGLETKEELAKVLSLDINSIDGIYPLTPTQEGFYLNDLIRGKSQSTMIGTSVLVDGPLDLERWQKALQVVSDQRAVLRTCVVPAMEGSKAAAYQVVMKSIPVDFEVLDWSGSDCSEKGGPDKLEQAQAYAKSLIYQAFELHHHALIRHRIIKLEAKKFIVVTSMHHMLMDAVSALEHWAETQRVYQQEDIAQDTYVDYLNFAQKTLDNDSVIAHWQTQMKGVVAPDYFVHGSLQRNHAAHMNASYQHPHGERISRRLWVKGEEWLGVKLYCRRVGVTPAILYKTIFGYLLNTYCQPQSDFYINEIITGRPKDFSRTLGNCFLIQPFVFRESYFSNESDILNLFSEAKKQQKLNRRFAYLSQQSREKISPQGKVGFYYNYLTFMPPEDFLGHAVDFRDWGNEIDEALEFNPRLGPEGLELNLFYREALFREQNFLESIQHLITQLIQGETKLSALRYQEGDCGARLSAAALKNQLSINDGSEKENVLSLIQHWFVKGDENVALEMHGELLTYQSLDDHSNQIAQFLKDQKLVANDIVVLNIEKSFSFIKALIGVLKAGAAYLPLDTTMPLDRQQKIIESSGAKLVITSELLESIFATRPAVAVQELSVSIKSKDLAYVIYTSGSTGEPKGVKVSHGALLGTFYAWQDAYDLNEKDQHLQMASVGFDVFTGDWVRALCSGACLHLVDKETLMDPSKLDEVIASQNISVAEFVPVVLRALSHLKFEQEKQLGLRLLIVGSDAWFESDQALLHKIAKPGTRLVNSYGVTEAVIDSTYFEELADDQRSVGHEDQGVSIGKPFANTQLYVLDEALKVLPKEVAGELYISGPDLADGYLNDEAQTQAAFLERVAGQENTLYRTGDRAKISQQEQVLLLGRIGQQAKIRGYRVELGEVETQLSLMPEVDEVVVNAVSVEQNNEDPKVSGQEKRLVAYLTMNEQQVVSSTEFRQVLSQTLPDYMLPQAYICLDSFPLTTNGKIDRKALPAPDFSTQSGVDYVAARNEIEQMLVAIWQGVLGLEKIGVYDNFFDLGGHSLLATQVMSRIRSECGKDLPLKTLFEESTIAYLATQVDLALKKDDALLAPEMLPVKRSALMPVSYAQQRFWFLDQLAPGLFAYNMPFAFKLKGTLNVDILRDSFEVISNRQELLNVNFVNDEGKAAAQVRPDEKWQLPLISFEAEANKVLISDPLDSWIKEQITANASAPFDLANDRLIRTKLLSLPQDEYVLLLCLHHIISDGWSLRILMYELALVYNALIQKRPSPLAPLNIQYLDFASWEQQWLSGPTLERYTDYWVEQLAGAPEILKLPCDKTRPAAQTFSGAQVAVKQSQGFKRKLNSFSKQHNASLFMTLMAGMSILMSRYSQEKDILMGTPIAGRNSVETESLMGLFLNALIIRARLEDNPTVSDLMVQMRETCLAAFAHQEMPAEILYEKLAKHRNPQYPAGVQVGLVLQNTATQQTQVDAQSFDQHLHDLSVELLGHQQVITNYDFGLTIVEQEDGINIIAEYNTDLFFEDTVTRMLDQYVMILDAMLDNDQLAIENIDLVNEDQLFSLLDLDAERYQNVLPLTAMQEGMYFANKLDPQSKEYGVGFSVRMHNPIDLALWTQSLQGLIDTQDVTRIQVVETDIPYLKPAYQCVRKSLKAEVLYLDWSDEEKTEAELESYAKRVIHAPYSICADELMRVQLIKLAEDYYLGIFCSHHFLMDGMSVVAFGVMAAINYEIVHNGGEAIVHPDQYQQYIRDDQFKTDSFDLRNFWKDQLKDQEALDFPVDMKGLEDSKKAKKTLAIAPEHWLAIQAYCKVNRITPALYFKSLYALVLNQYCKPKGDFYLYEILSGRDAAHLNALGCYFQQIPIPISKAVLQQGSTISDFFKAIRSSQKKSKRFQNISVPFQAGLLPQSRLKFLYNFEHFIPDFYFLGEQLDIRDYTNQVDGIVQFLVKTLASGAELNLYFQEGYFDDFNMLERISSISQQLVSGEQKIASLQMMIDDQESEKVFRAWNGDVIDFESLYKNQNYTLTARFENQAKNTPNAIAIVHGERSLSYQQVNEQANQLASYLQKNGAQKNGFVGICLERSPEFLLSILATLKIGAAYVPMDVQYPRERIQYMLKDSSVDVLISKTRFDELFEFNKHSNLVLLDKLADKINLESQDNLNVEINKTDRAYMIYTSGSTGEPKGAMIRHEGALNHIDAEREYLALDKKAFNFLQTAPASSDISVWQFLGPVICGGRSVVIDHVLESELMFNILKKQKVDLAELVPVALQLLIDYAAELSQDQRALPDLKWMMATGETVPVSLVNNWLALYPHIPIVNAYGPTEAADDVAQMKIAQSLSSQQKSVPVGNALANLSVGVIDEFLNPMPVGVLGEIFVSGVGVGEGYWQQPEKTANVFVKNPHDALMGDTIYRTGDIGRLLADGNIEYFDRIDNQVQIRGYRIELGEIESAINRYPGVKESVVIVQDAISENGMSATGASASGALSDASIVAYIVPVVADAQIANSEIRQFLQNYLAFYMLPNFFKTLESLPLTPVGKIDKTALPIVSESDSAREYVACQSETEKSLALMWADLLNLNISQVGRFDNFFELGGQSLIAVQLIARINKIFSLSLPLAILFEAQSLDVLAQKIDNQSVTESGNKLVPLYVNDEDPDHKTINLFYIHAISGEVIGYREIAHHLGRRVNSFGIQAQGLIKNLAVQEDINELVNDYIKLIKSQQKNGPYYLCGQSLGGILALAIAESLKSEGEDVALLAMMDSYFPNKNTLQEISLSHLESVLGAFMHMSTENMQVLSEGDQLLHLFEQAKAEHLIPKDIEFEQVKRLYDVANANTRLVQAYKLSGYDAGFVHFYANDTGEMNKHSASKASWLEANWSDIEFVAVEGDHESILKQVGAKTISDKLLSLIFNKNT